MPKDYSTTPELHPDLSAFDLSHNHFTTMDFGFLYPVAWYECVPGDVYTLDYQSLVFAQPFIAPLLNNLTMELFSFFVPTRLLWKDFESFFTTIEQGSIPPRTYEGTPPRWCEKSDGSVVDIVTSSHSLWDMFGLSRIFNPQASKELRPVDFLRRAYYFIWNEWFRDENLQEPIDFHNDTRQTLMRRAWRKDYFTAAFTTRQKGTAPSIPLTGTGKAVWNLTDYNTQSVSNLNNASYLTYTPKGSQSFFYTKDLPKDSIKNFLDDNTIDMSNVGTFDVSDMRDMFQIQSFLENLMRSGSRFVEVLQAIYGTSPTDARLSLPELIGRSKFNIQISQVLQNSASTDSSPQANSAGYGHSVTESWLGNYKAVEPGYIIVLANIQPPAVYTDRMPRELYRFDLLEQYNPYFVNLSYQEIKSREIYSDGTEQDNDIFAFTGRYDELREKMSYVTGDLYDKMAYYLNFRKFDARPAFNANFIECIPDNDVFAVQDEPPFIVNFWWDTKALRPLPAISLPGRIDHVYGGL